MTVNNAATGNASCRFCGALLQQSFCDLGMSPMANSYLPPGKLDQAEVFYPLHAFVCSKCLLVQLNVFESAEAIFSDYLYFSSYSQSWLDHAKTYVDEMISRFGIGTKDQVIEIASNDGYLLQYFVEQGVPALGIEPAENVAAVASDRGIETHVAFFGVETAEKLAESGTRADLLIGNNVLAHVPDLNDFVAGMSILLSPDGFITMEFPHLLELIKMNQFDTIYHEHFSYFSLLTVRKVFAHHGLRIFDVEQIPTHGGSLRIFACHTESAVHPTTSRVADLAQAESAEQLDSIDGYTAYPEQVQKTKRALLRFLIDSREKGFRTVAYGAPAKGNTLLNYCGIRDDLVEYTVDRSPHKQGHFLPGTHLQIHAPEHIRETRPDYVLILPWNLQSEIVESLSYIREWGGKFVIPIPEVQIIN